MTPGGSSSCGDVYWLSGGESCWEGGRRGRAGAGCSSSEGSGVRWRCEGASTPETVLEAAGAPPPSTLASDAAGPRDEVGELARGEASGSGSAVTRAIGASLLGDETGDRAGSL